MTPLLPCALLLLSAVLVDAGKQPIEMKVKLKSCDNDTMEIHVLTNDRPHMLLFPHINRYPDRSCEPRILDEKAVFKFPLNFPNCGVQEVTNVKTGARAYSVKLILDDHGTGAGTKEYPVSCKLPPRPAKYTHPKRTKRNVLPAGFQEEEVLEIRPMEKKVQPPQLGVAVRQGGQLVTGELNVNPGTPLQMEIFMDEQSAPLYGLLVSHMVVSDTRSQEETIIFNGCSVDPYLFENFNTVDGDFLSAKFRAFKFPESTYVQFRGTVSVCLDKCRGVECSNGVVGYGRKRRAVADMPPDPNKVFEVKLSTYIKVDYQDDEAAIMEKALLAARSEATLAVAASDSNALPPKDVSSGLEVVREEIRNFTVLEQSGTTSNSPVLALILVALFVLFFRD